MPVRDAVCSTSFSVALMHLQLIIAMHIMEFKCAMPNVFGSVRNAHTVQCSVAVRSLPTVYSRRTIPIDLTYAMASIRRLVRRDETICR